MKKRKVLVLGGKPIGSVELVNKLHENDLYVIVTDYLPPKDSQAKRIADEIWDISTADIEQLYRRIKEENVSAIMTGVHEFNINMMLDLCQMASFPCYCNKETWKYCDNKEEFKKLCKINSIPVAKEYVLDDLLKGSITEYPLIVKPVDGSGSRGFHICDNLEDLKYFYEKSKVFSPSKKVLIEEFIPYDSVIIHYTMFNGKCVYSCMSDKISVRFKSTGASVMGIQMFPSKGETKYLDSLNEKVIKMFERAGFTNGPIWIEAFFDGKDSFVFNEMGYRFGGSLTYYPVSYFTRIDQLDLMLKGALGDYTPPKIPIRDDNLYKYCILPLHIKSGIIKSVEIKENINLKNGYYAFVPVHFEGDIIQEWGSAQQVFAYVHILYTCKEDLINKIHTLFKGVSVKDERDKQMIHILFDINTIKI